MRGLSKSAIEKRRSRAVECLEERGFFVINRRYRPIGDVGEPNQPLFCLGDSLQKMARADAVYLLSGWEMARGCRVEALAAKEYGLKLYFEDKVDPEFVK